MTDNFHNPGHHEGHQARAALQSAVPARRILISEPGKPSLCVLCIIGNHDPGAAEILSTIMNILVIGYGTMCDRVSAVCKCGKFPLFTVTPSNTYRRGARYLIEILIEKISHFNIAYWDCLIKSYTLNMGRGVKYWKTSPEENIY